MLLRCMSNALVCEPREVMCGRRTATRQVNGTATRRAGRRNRYAAGRRNRYAVSGLSQCSRYAANDYLGRSGNKGQVMQIGG